MRKNRRKIKAIAKARKIDFLVHFTRLTNLGSILTHGIIPRKFLEAERMKAEFTDDERLDDCPEASSLSITHPNYKMFYHYRMRDRDTDWVVLGVSASVLWKYKCAFCVENAASARVTAIPVKDRMRATAFEAMFEDMPDKAGREELGIAERSPTNPQAEVLVFDTIDPKYIAGVGFKSKNLVQEWARRYPDYAIGHFPAIFSPRIDFKHWK